MNTDVVKYFVDKVLSADEFDLSANVIAEEYPCFEDWLEITTILSKNGWTWASLSGKRYKFIRF